MRHFLVLTTLITLFFFTFSCAEKASAQGSVSKVDNVTIYAKIKIDKQGEIKKEYSFPPDIEKLRYGVRAPIRILDVQGMEKLTNVKALIIESINLTGGAPSYWPNALENFSEVELLVIENCTLGNIDFLHNYPKLKHVIISSSRLLNVNAFDLRKFTQLESFWILGTRLQGQGRQPSEQLSQKPLEIQPNRGLETVVILSDQYALTMPAAFFESVRDVNSVVIDQGSYLNGSNPVLSFNKYSNVHFIQMLSGEDVRTKISPYIKSGQYYEDLIGPWGSYATIGS